MENWKQVIVAGNQAFDRGENVLAEQLYQRASYYARQQLGSWFDTEAAVSALIVSDLNMAETQCRLKRYQEAIETYASLNLDLRRFQCRFAQNNPIVAQVSQALARIKQEFLALTTNYAYDILDASPARTSPSAQAL